jgi:hypothetical protein
LKQEYTNFYDVEFYLPRVCYEGSTEKIDFTCKVSQESKDGLHSVHCTESNLLAISFILPKYKEIDIPYGTTSIEVFDDSETTIQFDLPIKSNCETIIKELDEGNQIVIRVFKMS